MLPPRLTDEVRLVRVPCSRCEATGEGAVDGQACGWCRGVGSMLEEDEGYIDEEE